MSVNSSPLLKPSIVKAIKANTQINYIQSRNKNSKMNNNNVVKAEMESRRRRMMEKMMKENAILLEVRKMQKSIRNLSFKKEGQAFLIMEKQLIMQYLA